MQSLLIKNGRVIDPANGVDRQCDILILDGKIAEIGTDAKSADTVIDASDRLVTPGLIDIHVHLREPGDEEEEKDGEKKGISPTAIGLILAIIIILITILAFVVMRRRDKKKDLGVPPPPPPWSPETVEDIAEPLDKGAPLAEEVAGETLLADVPMAEPAQPAEEPIEDGISEPIAEPAPSTEPTEPVQPAEPAEPAETAAEPAEAAPAAAETVPCPTCGSPIEVYAPACTGCNTEMEWRTPSE